MWELNTFYFSQLSPKHTPKDKFLCIYTHHSEHYMPQVGSPKHKMSNSSRSKWPASLLLDPCLLAPSLEIWTELFHYFLNKVLSVEKKIILKLSSVHQYPSIEKLFPTPAL